MGYGLRKLLAFFIATAVMSVLYFFFSFVYESQLNQKDGWLDAKGVVDGYTKMFDLFDQETQSYQGHYLITVKFFTEDGEERSETFNYTGREPYVGMLYDLNYDPNGTEYGSGTLPTKKDLTALYVTRYVSIAYAGLIVVLYFVWLISIKPKNEITE